MLEILVEIQASATVTLRGSTRGVVLSDGRSFSNFAVFDIQAFLQLGRFRGERGAPDVTLEVAYDELVVFDDQYTLNGKKVTVSVGQGREASSYVKPSTGTDRALVWRYQGFIPVGWRPTLLPRSRTCLLPLKDALSFQSHPILTDYIDRATYPRAFEQNKPFPILFGHSQNEPPGSILFPMDRIDRQVSSPFRGTWAIGNLPLATSESPNDISSVDVFADVIASPFDTAGLQGTKNNTTAQFSNVRFASGVSYPQARRCWYIGSGIGATATRPLPDFSTGDLIETCGHVLYWLLRYKAGIAASALDHAGIYGDNAPEQVTGAAAYYMVQSQQEVASAAQQIGQEVLAPLRWVDGNRQAAGDALRWTLAHVYINSELYYDDDSTLGVDPGWLLPDVDGNPRFDNLGAHRLYANVVDIQYGDWPAVSDHPTQRYYLQVSRENQADITARGMRTLELAHSWNNDPGLLLGGASGVGLTHADRWGSWDNQPWEWEWAFRLPMGDIIPGDLLNFGRLHQDPNDANYRFVFLVESTRLDWANRRLICRGPSIRVGSA